MRLRLPILMAFLLAAGTALAEFRFPMPEFSTDYHHPALSTPPPANLPFWLDAGLLLAALSLAAYLVLKRRSRRGVFALTLFSLAYFGFWRHGCVCSVGSLQNVVAGLTDSHFGVPLIVMAFFLLPLLFALFFGRVFCAAVCPLGAVQELVAVKPMPVPKHIESALGMLPYAYLGLTVLSVALGGSFLICEYDPFVAIFRQDGGFQMLMLGGLILLLGIVVARPYCRFLCPYGVLLNGLSRLSKWHASITPSRCIQCRLCADACPFNAIDVPTPEEPPEPRRRGIRRLAWILILAPVLLAAGAWTGAVLHEPLSRLHPTVRLAERLAGEDLGIYKGRTIESQAFRASDQPVADVYREAQVIQQRFTYGGAGLGAFLALVILVKLLATMLVRRRTDYEANRGNCLSCARCFKYCPVPSEEGTRH
jgi:ferredoxin